jgi:hypothetical protein
MGRGSGGASANGSVDRGKDFDRRFRPTSPLVRERWQRMAAAVSSGTELPAISAYRVGQVHFVVDGHHRVSVPRPRAHRHRRRRHRGFRRRAAVSLARAHTGRRSWQP